MMRGFSKGLLISSLVHMLIGAVVYAISADRLSKPETISIDFTLTDQETIPEALQGNGTALGPRSMAKPKIEEPTRAPRPQEARHDRTEQDVRTVDRDTTHMRPAIDPVESNQQVTASLDNQTAPPGIVSSPEGAPVADKAGSAVTQGRTGGDRNVTSLERTGSSGISTEGSGGNQGSILREIRDSIMKNVTYPDKARRMGWEGRVVVSFTVYENGSIGDTRIVQSSGTIVLDEAAREALRKSTVRAQFAGKIQVVLPIDYKLK